MVVLAGGVLITFGVSIGGLSLGQPAGSADAPNRNGSFMGGIEQITDSLVHLLDGGAFKGEKNTVRAGVYQSAHQDSSMHRGAEFP